MYSLLLSFLCLIALVSGQYIQPPWFNRIRGDFEASGQGPVRRCFKRDDVPPVPGVRCAENRKMCFFGTQTCPDGDLNPVTQCMCPGRPDNEWSCAPFSCDCLPPASCPSVTEVVPDNELNVNISGIVDAVNKLRQSQVAGQELSPVPCQLPCLAWNKELAERALAWALNCDAGLDPDRNSVTSFTAVGKIGRATNVSPVNVTALAFGSFGDLGVEFYDYTANTCTAATPGLCNDYLQLVSNQTTAIGCAAVACPRIVGLPFSNPTNIHCFFGEAIVDGVRPYVTSL